MHPKVSKFTSIFGSLVLGTILFVALLELGLRLVPIVIPEAVLMDFNEVPRADIAEQRNLPSISDTVLVRRDDGGPELRIPKPFTIRNWRDNEFGAAESTQVDGMGFCNPISNNYDDHADLLALGDSFIWCTGIDPQYTWPNLLSNSFGVDSYNLAAVGIGLHEHVQLLKKFGLAKSPRIVIMNFYEGNDLRDAEYYLNYVEGFSDELQLSSSDRKFCELFQSPIKSRIGELSYSYNITLVLLNNVCETSFDNLDPAVGFSERWVGGEGNFKYKVKLANFSVDYNLKDVHHDEVVYADKLRLSEIRMDVLIKPLIDFVELSKYNGFIPILTYTPSAYTTYRDYVIFEDKELNELMDWFSLAQREFLDKQSDLLGLRFVDLTPGLRDAAVRTQSRNDQLYFPVNMHLTIRGHQVVADAVQSIIRESQHISLSPDVGGFP